MNIFINMDIFECFFLKIDSDVFAKRILNIFKIEYHPKKLARLMVSDLLFSITSRRNEFALFRFIMF